MGGTERPYGTQSQVEELKQKAKTMLLGGGGIETDNMSWGGSGREFRVDGLGFYQSTKSGYIMESEQAGNGDNGWKAKV